MRRRPTIRAYGPILLVAVGYFVAARLSLLLAFEHTNVTPVWPPTGIALALVLLWGYRVTPGVFVGAFFANLMVLSGIGFLGAQPIIASLSTALGNSLEAVIGAALIHRFTGRPDSFEDVKDVFVFVLFGTVLSTMVSATIGVVTLCIGTGDWQSFHRLWLTWWLGDATGAIVVVPVFFGSAKLTRLEWRAARVVEAASALALLLVTGAVIFFGKDLLRYLIFPVLLWIILRFGLFEVSLSLVVLSGLAIYGVATRSTSLTGEALGDSLLYLQSFIAVVAVTSLFLSVVVRRRRVMEDALRAEKGFTDTLIDSVPGAFFVLDRLGRLVRWNRFLEEMNSLSGEELTDMNSLRNIHEDDRGLVLAKIEEAFVQGISETEARIHTKTGLRHLLFTGRRVDIEGTPYVVGSGIDVTRRKEAETQLIANQRDLEEIIAKRTAQLMHANEALARENRECKAIERTLAESEQKYRDLVEGANSVILRWTREGKITFINRFALEFFGYSLEEIVGRNIVGTIVPPVESSGKSLSLLAHDVFENPEAYILNENENIRKNGERVWVSWTNKPVLNDEGAVVEILSVGNDTTRRRNAELQLTKTLEELASAKERAEAADRLKSAFLATMSHELRTPLNSIIGFTGIILQGYVGPLNEEQAKQLAMVRNSANHLLSLINDVLDISKIEAGQLQVSWEPFDFRLAVERCVNSVRPAAEKKGIALSVALSSGIDTIVSDQRRVEQVLLNLLSNAVKFTEEGEVMVECTKEGDGMVRACITDTGIGIKDEDMDRLFNAFQQVDSGTTRKYEGTGLGLYICRKLAELLGGRIVVTSEWGKGTKACFTMPEKGRD